MFNLFNLFAKKEENTYSIEESIQILFNKINNLEEQNLHIEKEFKNELDKKDIVLLNYKNELIKNKNNFNDLENAFKKLQDDYNILNNKFEKVNEDKLELQNDIGNIKNEIINKIKEENGLLKMQINKVNYNELIFKQNFEETMDNIINKISAIENENIKFDNNISGLNDKLNSDTIIIGHIVLMEFIFNGIMWVLSRSNLKSIIKYNKYDENITIKLPLSTCLLSDLGPPQYINSNTKEVFSIDETYINNNFKNLKKLHNESCIPLILFCDKYKKKSYVANNNIGEMIIYINDTVKELVIFMKNIYCTMCQTNDIIFNNLIKLKIIGDDTDIINLSQSLFHVYKFTKMQEKLEILELPILYEKYKGEHKDLIKHCTEKNITLNWV